MEDVRDGDVLLFHGKSFVSWAIRVADGTEVNHVAIAIGDRKLAEAGGLGLQSGPIPNPGGGEYILVHRLKATSNLDPVVAVAQDYLQAKNFYAYQQIVLLAVLCLTRRLKLPRLARRLARAALDHAAGALMDLLPAGKSWMICSEYVYRSFAEAKPGDDTYKIDIAGASFAPPPSDSQPLIDWGIANARDIQLTPSASFGPAGAPADPVQRIAAIEADLAPYVIDYAQALHAEGLISEDDLPPLRDASFGPQPDLGPEPTDQEMLVSAANFAAQLLAARGQPLPSDASFGGVGATIGAAALKGALEGLRTMTVKPDFVTPGDLLNSPSLQRSGRLGS